MAIEGEQYADIEDIQKLTNAILNIISTDEIKMSFNSVLDHASGVFSKKEIILNKINQFC